MIRRAGLRADERGATAVEFALLAPVLLTFILGTLQLGMLFMASAGLHHAVGAAARHATLFPTPSAQQIQAKLEARAFGLDPDRLETHDLVEGRDGSLRYIDVRLSYEVQMDFVLWRPEPFTITRTRRAYLI